MVGSWSTQSPRLRVKALEKEPQVHHNLLGMVKKVEQVVIRMLSGWETEEERRGTHRTETSCEGLGHW